MRRLGLPLRGGKIFDSAFHTAFSRLTFRYFIPCLLFASVVRTDLGGLARVRLFWLAYFLPATLVFLTMRLRSSPSRALAVVYSNTVLIGIPLVLSTFGEEAMGVTLTVVSLNGLTLFTPRCAHRYTDRHARGCIWKPPARQAIGG